MEASNLSLPEEKDIPILFNRMARFVDELNYVLEFIGEGYQLWFDCDHTKASLIKMSATGDGDDRPLADVEKGEYELWRVTRFDPVSKASSINSFTGSQTCEILHEQLVGAFEGRAADILSQQTLDMPLQTFTSNVLGAVIHNPTRNIGRDVQKSLDFINGKLQNAQAAFHFEQLIMDKKVLVFKIENSIEFNDVATILPGGNNYYNFIVPQIDDADTAPVPPQIRDATDIIMMLENRLEAHVDPETKRETGQIFNHTKTRALPPPTWQGFRRDP